MSAESSPAEDRKGSIVVNMSCVRASAEIDIFNPAQPERILTEPGVGYRLFVA